MSCEVCIEKYNQSSRTAITCDYCGYSSCQTCYIRYILAGSTFAKCMNCKRDFTRKALSIKFKQSFYNGEYVKHRENILFDIQRAMMPATQAHMERLARLKLLRRTEIPKLATTVKNRHVLMDGLFVGQFKRKDLTAEELVGLYNSKNDFLETTEKLETELASLREEHDSLSDDKSQKHVKVVTRKCLAENCRGFLDSSWRCGLCGAKTCRHCLVVESQQHTCSETDIATAVLLQTGTRNCPSCGTGIFRVSGCSQMWCTECHTAFDWNTGSITTGPIHNPEFFEWRRKNGILRGDGPEGLGDFDPLCGQILDHNIVARVALDNDVLFNSHALRNLIHLRVVEIPRFRTDYFETTRVLRMRYLGKEISENAFKTQIQRIDKKIEKNREIHNLLELYTDCFTGILYRLADENVLGTLSQYHAEINALREYTCEQFENIARVYKCKTWVITRNNALK